MEYNLKITTDDSDLQSTKDLLVEIGDAADEIQGEVEDAFDSGPVDSFTESTEDATAAMNAQAAAAAKATKSQNDLNKSTDKADKSSKRFGTSLVTNALRLAGFNKEARLAGAALNILNKVSLSKVGEGITNLFNATKNLATSGINVLTSGLKSFAAAGANAFKALVTSARISSLAIRGAVIATGIGGIAIAISFAIANFDKLKKVSTDVLKGILFLVNPVLGIFALLGSSVLSLGDKFESVFNATKEVINEVIASTRNLLSTITGGLIDSAERAAQRAAQAAREANTETLKSSKDTLEAITDLQDSAFEKQLRQAKALGATQKEIDELTINNNKEKAAFLNLELQKQNEIVASLQDQINKLDQVGIRDEAQNEARKKAFEEQLKARTEANKLEQAIAQTSIDTANIVEAAAEREAAAIRKANEERRESERLEQDRLRVVDELTDKLLRSEQERLIRDAELQRDARRKQIEQSVKDNELKNKLIAANDELFIEQKNAIEAEAEQAKFDLINSISLNSTDLKIQKINQETQKRIDSIKKIVKDEKKADELIQQLQKKQADKIQEIQAKSIEKQIKEEAKRIKNFLEVEDKKLQIKRNTDLALVDSERQRGESEEQFAARIAKEKQDIELKYQKSVLKSRLAFNTQLSDLDKKIIKQQIEDINNTLGANSGNDAITNNPFDFKSKITQALQDLGLDGQQADQALAAAQQFAGQIIGQFEAAADARLQASQELVEFRNENIDRLNEELANEIEINKLGLASNIERVQQEIEEEKRLRDEALAQQEIAAKKKEQIETAQQAASLLTAIAQLYSSLSGIPFVGLALATAASAALVAQFAASKVKVASLTKLEHGGLVDGPSHAQGGVKYYSADGRNVRELEGNEFVTPVKQTKKHYTFLEAMRKGSFDNIDLMAAINNPDSIDSMNKDVINYNIQRNTSNNKDIVNAISSAAMMNKNGLLDLQDRPTVWESNGYLYREVNKNGNRTVTKIKIN